MAEGKTFDMEEEFAGLDFNSKRLEKRFKRTMKTLAKQPGESIWRCSAVTHDGLVHGVLDQTHYNRPQAKDDTMTARLELKLFGRVCKNFIPSSTTVSCLILWVKYRASCGDFYFLLKDGKTKVKMDKAPLAEPYKTLVSQIGDLLREGI
jgi:hypothetical protein